MSSTRSELLLEGLEVLIHCFAVSLCPSELAQVHLRSIQGRKFLSDLSTLQSTVHDNGPDTDVPGTLSKKQTIMRAVRTASIFSSNDFPANATPDSALAFGWALALPALAFAAGPANKLIY